MPLLKFLFMAERDGVALSKDALDTVLPMLKRIPVDDLSQLELRLKVLGGLAGRGDPGGELLFELVDSGRLPEALLEEIETSRVDIVLRFYDDWLAAATRDGGCWTMPKA